MSKIVRTKTPGDAWATTVEPEGGSGDGLLQSAVVPLSSADLLALGQEGPGDEFALVAAPGSGKAHVIMGGMISLALGDTPYQLPSESIELLLSYPGNENYALGYSALILGTDAFGFGTAFEQDTVFFFDTRNADTGVNWPKTLIEDAPIQLCLKGDSFNSTTGGLATSSLNHDTDTGYAPGDTFRIQPINGPDGVPISAIAEVDTVDGGGQVQTYHLTDPGSGFSTENTPRGCITVTGGGSGDWTANILSVDTDPNGDGTAEVTVFYITVDL